jgi:hypothetical protein
MVPRWRFFHSTAPTYPQASSGRWSGGPRIHIAAGATRAAFRLDAAFSARAGGAEPRETGVEPILHLRWPCCWRGEAINMSLEDRRAVTRAPGRPRQSLIEDLVQEQKQVLLKARTVAVSLRSALREFGKTSYGPSHDRAATRRRWLERASALVQDVRAQSLRARHASRRLTDEAAPGAADADVAELRAITQRSDRVIAGAESDMERLLRRTQPGKRPRTHSTTRPIPVENDGPAT